MFPEQQNHINIISEGSYGSEDWSNNAKIQLCISWINYIWKYIQMEEPLFHIVIIFHYMFYQINTALWETSHPKISSKPPSNDL